MSKEDPYEEINNVAYIHLTRKGKIFYIEGATGLEKWISVEELKDILQQLRIMNGRLLYSREEPSEEDPPEMVESIFNIIASYEIPITFTLEPHPRALDPDR